MMKSTFEEQLEALAGADGLKAAKQLLKQGRLNGVWYDSPGVLRGIFSGDNGEADCSVKMGKDAVSECSLCSSKYPCCPHGTALIMYSGRFKHYVPQEPEPFYYRGLRREPIPALLDQSSRQPTAELYLESSHVSPHAPSKWENTMFKIKIRGSGREYMGNMANLRQIYFDKFLSSTVRWESFSLQDRQIIRFLALNGEAENSAVSLPAELTAELFHSLIGFERLTRNGRNVIIRGERGEAVLLVNGRKCIPGIRAGNSVFPVQNSQIIVGRTGCWLGCDGEYFFLPASCEINFMRSFFTSPQVELAPEELQRYLASFPFQIIKVKNTELPRLPMSIFLDGFFNAEDDFELDIRFLYTRPDGSGVLCVPESAIVQDGFRRDRDNEIRFIEQLDMFGFQKINGKFVLSGLAAIGTFFTGFLPALIRSERQVIPGPGLMKNKSNTFIGQLDLSCKLEAITDSCYKLRFNITAFDETAEWNECCETALAGGRYVKFSGNRIAEIPEAAGIFFRSAGVMFRNIDSAGMTFELPFCNTAYYREICRKMPGMLLPEIIEGPESCRSDIVPCYKFKGELRNYQRSGVEFMRYLTDRNLNCLLADEMGLGKTVQLLALLSSRLEKESLPAMIVCPASLLTNWEREAGKFVPGLKVGIPEGASRKKFWENYRQYGLIVTSYTMARLDIDNIKRCKFSYLVLDEAQHIKNPGSTNAKSCKSIPAEHRIVLTGTPLENCSADLWSIFDFIQPGMLGVLSSFRRRYAAIDTNRELQEDLKMRISPFIKRRTKSEVAADLPLRTENIIYCDFSPAQRALYEEILQEGRLELAGAGSGEAQSVAIFTVLLRLRQVCCHPELLGKRGHGVPSVKSELFSELIQQNVDSGHKLLAFSQFTSLLALLKQDLDEQNIPYEYLDGATVERQKHVDNFNNNPEIPLFLLSLKAGGTGLNLVSADRVVIYDPWWNPAAELQAADRAHRIGQTRPVTVCKLVVRNSIEEKIIALQGRKKAVFDALITSGDEKMKISAAELRSLLEE